MPKQTYLRAVGQAIRDEMRVDPTVFVMGEDVRSGIYGDFGVEEFGEERVRDTPISEAGFFGAGIGAALTGMRPIIEATASTFLYCAMDQLVNQAAKMRYMTGGQVRLPIVFRAQVLFGVGAAAHHSDRAWAMFAQCPGLKIVVPSGARDARGLMTAAIRDDGPVLIFEDSSLWGRREEMPEDDHVVPIGVAEVKREGREVTIVALASAVHHALGAAATLAEQGIEAEVIDLRSVVPLDRATILSSVRKTGRLIVVDPAPLTCSIASEVAATVVEQAFDSLRAPIVRLTAPDVPVPFAPSLERLMYPDAERIVAAARQVTMGSREEVG
jgi:acetoin:2,6-dichlorophenolindophenol oxidoreductase subunit beta